MSESKLRHTGTNALGHSSSPDPWQALRRWTPARIALGRAGGSQPTPALLDFRLAHARAIDAVHQPFDAEAFAKRLLAPNSQCAALLRRLGTVQVITRVPDANAHLQRPDWGRKLSEESRARLESVATKCSRHDLVIVVADGLSALAVEKQVPAVLGHLLPLLDRDWKLAPLVIARFGRVALQDEIGSVLGATLALSLIGERPGLIGPDSLSAYLVFNPAPGNTDANRNCISNIRPDGLSPANAAAKIHYLLTEARHRKLSGVALKDEFKLPFTPRSSIRE